MNTILRVVLPALLLAVASGAGAADIKNKAALAEHIQKAFRTPPHMKINIIKTEKSEIAGFLKATIQFSNGEQSQTSTVIVSEDERWYFTGGAFKIVDSKVKGLKTLAPQAGGAPTPPVFITEDGKHVVYGNLQDLSIDPDADNLAKMKLEGAPTKGPKDAPVVIVEYSDLQCPHCMKAHDFLEEKLKPYQGKIRRVFKHFPLKFHDWAYDAALGVACAGSLSNSAANQMTSWVFKDQKNISKENVSTKLTNLAKRAGLDSAKFTRCVTNKESKTIVDANIREGDSLGIAGTPSIYVNGRKIRRYDDIAELKALVEQHLD